MDRAKRTITFAAAMLVAINARAAGPLDYLKAQSSRSAYVIDTAFDPTHLVGTLSPPWESGANQLTRIELDQSGGRIVNSFPLGDLGAVLAFSLSPDGDTALVGRIEPNEIVVVRGLRRDRPVIDKVISLDLLPLSFGFSPDGSHAVVGLQRNGSGRARLAVVDGLPDEAHVAKEIDLGVRARVLAAVESVDFSPDGNRVFVNTGIHHDSAPPLFFLPKTALQVIEHPRSDARVSGPLYLPRHSAIPPQPPFDGLLTGVALGDSAVLCDGDRALVPIPGALDLGQPDARIALVRGLRRGLLEIERIFGPTDGVGVGPLQVSVGADCQARVVNAFSSTVTVIGGLLGGGPVTLSSMPTGYPFPSEAVSTPNLRNLVVHHPRPPINDVPPAAVTVADGRTLEPLGGPLQGPVVGWVQAKDQTIDTWTPGLIDSIRALRRELPSSAVRDAIGGVRRAVRKARKGKPAQAQGELRRVRNLLATLANEGRVHPDVASHLIDRVGVALPTTED